MISVKWDRIHLDTVMIHDSLHMMGEPRESREQGDEREGKGYAYK